MPNLREILVILKQSNAPHTPVDVGPYKVSWEMRNGKMVWAASEGWRTVISDMNRASMASLLDRTLNPPTPQPQE